MNKLLTRFTARNKRIGISDRRARAAAYINHFILLLLLFIIYYLFIIYLLKMKYCFYLLIIVFLFYLSLCEETKNQTETEEKLGKTPEEIKKKKRRK